MVKQVKRSRISKLATLKGLLNGSLSVASLIEPKVHLVNNIKRDHDGTLLEEETFHCGNLVMNLAAFEEWKKENVGPHDKVVMMVEDLRYEPLIDIPGTNISCRADMAYLFTNRGKASVTPSNKRPAKERLLIDNGSHPKDGKRYIEYEVIPEPANVAKRGGKLSEYGDKWQMSEESVDALQPRGWKAQRLKYNKSYKIL